MGGVLFRERGFFCNVAVGVIDVSVFAKTGWAGYFLRRPAAEVFYADLDGQDGGRIAEARKEAEVPFDVNSAGKPVLVCYRESAPTQFGKLEKMTGDSIPPANSGYICR